MLSPLWICEHLAEAEYSGNSILTCTRTGKLAFLAVSSINFGLLVHHPKARGNFSFYPRRATAAPMRLLAQFKEGCLGMGLGSRTSAHPCPPQKHLPPTFTLTWNTFLLPPYNPDLFAGQAWPGRTHPFLMLLGRISVWRLMHICASMMQSIYAYLWCTFVCQPIFPWSDT